MNKTIFLILCCLPFAAHGDAYDEARARLVTAYQAQDYAAMRLAARDALAARPGHPGARFNLALAQVLDDDPASSLWTLHRLADDGIFFPIEDAEEFAPLREKFTWLDFLFKLNRLQRPQGNAKRIASFGPSNFIPEGILVRDDGSVLLGSIHLGQLLKWSPDGGVETLSTPETGGHWSIFGIREDAEGMAWFASAALPNFRDLDPQFDGRTGLFRINPDSGEILDELLLPDDGRKRLLGDLVIADNGLIFATDSLGGSVYRYDPELRELQELVKPGQLQSPQGLVLLDGEQQLLVADYATGLYRVDVNSGAIDQVVTASGVSTHGIDGLYREDDTLIAVINGTQPHRVMRLAYDAARNRIDNMRLLLANHRDFIEPTLGQVMNHRFYLVANSQWNRFDQQGRLPADGLFSPVILEIALDERPK